MAAYVLIPNLAFEGHRDALLERARKDSGYGCFQYRGDEVAVGFAFDASAHFFYGYCLAQGIRPQLELPDRYKGYPAERQDAEGE
jgi:hypothetical protein